MLAVGRFYGIESCLQHFCPAEQVFLLRNYLILPEKYVVVRRKVIGECAILLMGCESLSCRSRKKTKI